MWGRFQLSLDQKQSQLNAAREKLGNAKLTLEKARKAMTQLGDWQERSLPDNREVAQSLYRVRLENQFKDAGLAIDDIQPDRRVVPTDAYTAIGYTVTARGTIKSLATLLFDFYRSPLLQQITYLQLQPSADPSQLMVTFKAEALMVRGSKREDLPTGTTERPAKASAEEYVESITGRNLMAVYSPPKPAPVQTAEAPKPVVPKFDDAKFAYVTGIVQVEGRLQAWINVRTTGETLRVFEGDAVKVGSLEGNVLSIEPRRIVLKLEDEELKVELGRNLREDSEEKKTEAG